MTQPLFPPYLDQGSNGPAVNVLGLILKAMEITGAENIVLDGDFTPNGAIAGCLKILQEVILDFKGDAVDGNFGPETRAALLRVTGLDVNALTVEMFIGETTTPERPVEEPTSVTATT